MTSASDPSMLPLRSWFVRPVPRHPERFIPDRVEPDEEGEPDKSAFERHVPVEPAPFVVGLDEFAAIERHSRRVGIPPLSTAEFKHAPFDVERYLGRVAEVSPGGVVIATLWEVPSGRRGTASFSPTDTHFEPELPIVGACVWVWAWSEVTSQGRSETRKLVHVENPKLEDGQRQELRAFLARFGEPLS